MAIDKRITHRRNFKGGADMGTVDATDSKGNVTRAATNKAEDLKVSAGGASFKTLGPEPDARRYAESRQEFVDNLNRNNATRFEPSFTRRTYKPETLDTVGSRNQLRNKGGVRNLFRTLLNFALPGSNFLFNKGNQGITNINNALGDFREKFTGYRTQEEYDNARQQRINLNRINTIQNTLDTKYADGDYSNTNLDERLAGLQSLMGIVPNTPEQDAQQFLNFGNELAENTQQTIFPAPTQDITTYMPQTNTPYYNPDRGINTLRFAENKPLDTRYPAFEYSDMFSPPYAPLSIDTQRTPSREYPFTPFNNASVDASTDTNEELLRQLLNTQDTGIDNFIDQKNESENRQQELLNSILTG